LLFEVGGGDEVGAVAGCSAIRDGHGYLRG
jgi:hypothetical protein